MLATSLPRCVMVLSTVFVALLAGCVSDADDAPLLSADPVPAPLGPVGPNVTTVQSQYTFDVRDAGLSSFIGENKLLLVDIDANVTTLVAELRWNDPLDDLDLYVYSPAMCTDAPLTGQFPDRMMCAYIDWWTYGSQSGSHVVGLDQGPNTVTYLRLDIDEDILNAEACPEAPCRWRVVVGSELMVQSNFEIAASLFTNETVPDGYSAFADA